ncbi:MAG: type III-A CRISPR-associated protein Csm2 [Bacteroidales bacterium]|nr:type III-A CRISPR-associated protein Csm2 [Bacteroidales bacterium]
MTASNANYRNNTENQSSEYITNDDVKKWIINGIDANAIKKTEEFGKQLANKKLSTSQIRNVFGEMRRIQMNGYMKEKAAFMLLKPKLAYAVKRNENKGIKMFYEVFCYGYDAVDKTNDDIGAKQFENFMHLLEAILAYHKYYGGKE